MRNPRRPFRQLIATIATGVVVLGSGALITTSSAYAAPAKVTLSGKITDGSGHGWALYARITVQGGQGGPSGPVYTNPFTGHYQVRLPGVSTWSLTVEPVYPGYATTTSSVPLGTHNVARNLSVPVDGTSCSAPGYQLGATSCDPVPGGLVAGLTRDAVANKPLPDVQVASNDVPAESGSSAATPNDPGLADGFYWLFSSVTGSHPFTATRQHYASRAHPVNVRVDGVTRQDFALGAGRLKVSPAAVSASVRLGHNASKTLTLRNTGTSPLHVSLIEQDGALQFAAARTATTYATADGAPVSRVRGHYSPLRQAGRDSNARKVAVRPVAPSIAPSVALPAATPWAAITDYPVPVQDNAAAFFDGKLYSVGGFDGGQDLASLYVYDPGAAAWTQLTGMSTTREVPQAAWIGGKLYVTGGWGPNGEPTGVTEAYDPTTDSWTPLATNPDPFAAASRGIVLHGKLYAIGGCSASSCGSADVQVYDPTTDSWSSGPAYPTGVSWESCGTISGQIYCAGGTTDAGTSKATYSFDGTTWTRLADMPVDDWGGYYAAADGQLVVSSGAINGSSQITNESWSYDPATDQWSSLPASNNADYRGSGACGFYKVGGNPGGVFVPPAASAEVLPGFDDCDSDVPWLSETPTSLTLAPGASRTVTVRMDSAPLTQPGTYVARIALATDTPYPVSPVRVTFHVNP